MADAQSGISLVEVAVGSQPLAQQVLQYTALADASDTSAALTGLELEHQGEYWVSVRATNGAGIATTHTSLPVLVDASAPWPQGSIRHAGTGMQKDTMLLPCNYSMFSFVEQESWISTIAVGVGSSAGADDVRSFQDVAGPLPSEVIFMFLSLSDGDVFCVAKATNAAGLTTVASSPPIVVDTSPPLAGLVVDVVVDSLAADDAVTSALDTEFQAFVHQLGAAWAEQTDAHSGVVEVVAAVGTGTAPDARESVLSFASSADLTHANRVILDAGVLNGALEDGSTYYVTLRVTNGAGMQTYVVAYHQRRGVRFSRGNVML